MSNPVKRCMRDSGMITIRTAEVDDAGAMGAAHAVAWQTAYRGMIPDSYLDAIDPVAWGDRWRGILTGEIEAPGVEQPANLVAETGADVVGFASVGRFRGAPDDPTLGELWAMYVHPDQWGTGAGYALMKATTGLFGEQGFRRAHLWVLEQNDLARRFYERQGWVAEDGIRVEEIGGGTVSEVRYRLEL